MTETVRRPFQPVARRTVSEEIRAALQSSIRDGVFPPGSQLPSERALCEEFGVARTSVREAIQGLMSLGEICKRGNRFYVAEQIPDVAVDSLDGRKHKVRELFEVRRVFEMSIVRLTAERATVGDRREIAGIASGFSTRMALDAFRNSDRAFHWAVARACGNPTLVELYGKVLDTLFRSEDFDALLYASSNERTVRQIIRDATRAHHDIAAAITSGDGAAAVAAAETHLEQVENLMIARMV